MSRRALFLDACIMIRARCASASMPVEVSDVPYCRRYRSMVARGGTGAAQTDGGAAAIDSAATEEHKIVHEYR